MSFFIQVAQSDLTKQVPGLLQGMWMASAGWRSLQRTPWTLHLCR